MTLGEKLKEARKQTGLSQEQLSEKLGVSRSAVAKWETNKGIPDVDNLKALSQLLNVSVDYLLNDGDAIDELTTREPYNFSDYGKAKKKAMKDRAVREKFPEAEIQPLIGKVKLTKGECIFDNVLGFLTDAPFGIPEFINWIKNTDKAFYLIESDQKQFLVTVTDEFIETHRLAKRVESKKFEIGDWKFTKDTYKVK
ncbi:helix-turn-helix domain-containing protein [Ruminococcus sp.]|uniref:helix-turn-helix domain-containing protein n=1 Tax=Ruminococcus sp. TaxID=41978 RepID=UPI003F01B419